MESSKENFEKINDENKLNSSNSPQYVNNNLEGK